MKFRKTFLTACLLTSLVVFSSPGCRDEQATPDPSGEAAGSASTLLPFPDDKTLEALGPKNDIETRWMLENPLLVLAMHPKRFLESEIAKGNEDFLSESIAQGFKIPFAPLQLVRVVQVSGMPFSIVVESEVNGRKMPEQVGLMRRTTEFTFAEPVLKEEVIRFLLMDSAASIDTLKKKEGSVEYYDLSGTNNKHPGRAAVAFPDDKTVVLLEGHVSDISTVFDGIPPKSAAVERLQRMDTKSDLMMALSLEGNGVPSEEILPMLLQYGMPGDLAELIAGNFRAATLSLDLSSAQSSAVASIVLDTKNEKSAKAVAEKIDGQIVRLQTDWMALDENQRAALALPYEFLTSLFNSIVVEAKEARVLLHAEKFEGLAATVNRFLQSRQALLREAQLQQSRQEQLMILGRFFQMYYDANGKFPSDIKAADGTPLLSWRVAILPTMQQNELYAKFNLQEPWDGPTNKELLAQMPFLFRPLAPGVEPPKTLIRFFSSEGTPLSNPNLKKEDVKHPESTLMLLGVAPTQAVEWTRPDVLTFELESMEKTTGNVLFGTLFTGQFVPGIPILPLTDERSVPQRKFLDALVRGLPLPDAPATPASVPPTTSTVPATPVVTP